jgi:hypothetical protein
MGVRFKKERPVTPTPRVGQLTAGQGSDDTMGREVKARLIEWYER